MYSQIIEDTITKDGNISTAFVGLITVAAATIAGFEIKKISERAGLDQNQKNVLIWRRVNEVGTAFFTSAVILFLGFLTRHRTEVSQLKSLFLDRESEIIGENIMLSFVTSSYLFVRVLGRIENENILLRGKKDDETES